MRQLDIKTGYMDNFDGTMYLLFYSANTELPTILPGRNQTILITIGSLDAPNNIFPNPEDGLNYHYSSASAAILSAVNGAAGSTLYFLGDRITVYKDVYDYAQAHADILDDLSASTIANGELVMRNTSGDFEGTSLSDVAAEVMAQPSFAAMKATMELGTAANFDESHFALSSRTVNGHALTGNVTVTKSDVSLGNVDNTSDANKPVSTATQTALNAKFNSPSGTTAQYIRGDGSLATLPTSATRSFNNNPSRTLTTSTGATGFQVSATRDAVVNYSVTIDTSVSLSGNSKGYVVLEVAPTNSATAGDWVEVGRTASGQSGTLVVGLVLNQTGGGQVGTVIPAGYYAKLRSVNTNGTPTYTYNSGQEVLL